MENHPDFAKSTSTQSLDELRHAATRRHNIINAQKFWTPVDVLAYNLRNYSLNHSTTNNRSQFYF